MRTDDEQAEIDRRSEARIVAIVTMFSDLSEREREETVSRLRGRFCLACGTENPRCQCQNDE